MRYLTGYAGKLAKLGAMRLYCLKEYIATKMGKFTEQDLRYYIDDSVERHPRKRQIPAYRKGALKEAAETAVAARGKFWVPGGSYT